MQFRIIHEVICRQRFSISNTHSIHPGTVRNFHIIYIIDFSYILAPQKKNNIGKYIPITLWSCSVQFYCG